MADSSEAHRIVVGIDGSEPSKAALGWAVKEARHWQARLVVLYVFPAMTTLLGSTGHEYNSEVADEAKARLGELLASAPPMDGVDVEADAVPGNPAEVLVEESREASLVVVGSRGHGGVKGLLLGSVSHHVTQLAHCPVVVVRGPGEAKSAS